MTMQTKISTAAFPHETAGLRYLNIDVRAHIGYIRLAETAARPIDEEILQEIVLAHEALEYNDDVYGVIWSSDAQNEFLGGWPGDFLTHTDPADILKLYRYLFHTVHRIYEFSKPELVLLSGSVSGPAALLISAADWRIVSTEEPRFSYHDTMPGIPLPHALMQMLVSGLGERNMAEFSQSGYVCSGATAVRLGLANELVHRENLHYRGDTFMKHLIHNPLEYLQARKRHLRRTNVQAFEREQGLGDALLCLLDKNRGLKSRAITAA